MSRLWIILGIFSAFFLRLIWLGDMEFKGDELETLRFITSLQDKPWTFLAPISQNSGIAHSSGFFYFARILSFGSSDPLHIAAGIAAFNAFCISVGLVFLRKTSRARLTFLLAATSLTLVLGSRKIWAPCLVPAFVTLSLALTWAGLERGRRGFLILGNFLIFLAGHMYLPGLLFGAVVSVALGAWFLIERRGPEARAWFLGAALGALTFVPYVVLVLTHAPGTTQVDHGLIRLTHSSSGLTFWNSIKIAFLQATPFEAAKLYFFRPLPEIRTAAPAFAVESLRVLLLALEVLGVGLVAFAGVQLVRFRRQAWRDPLVPVSVAVLAMTVVALQILRLGNYWQYWLGTTPFAFYLVAWSMDHARRMRHLAYATVLGSALACLLFLGLVHFSPAKSFPGEYGTRYSPLQHQETHE